VSPEWLLTGRGQGPRDEFRGIAFVPEEETTPKVPVIGYVGAADEAHFYAVAQGDLDHVLQPSGSSNSTVAVDIRGDSLGPWFNKWLVFYDSVRRPPTPDVIGEFCIVGMSDGRILLKQVHKGGAEGLYNLSSPDQPTIIDAKIEWVSKITSLSQRS
jgi:hypothetical protein